MKPRSTTSHARQPATTSLVESVLVPPVPPHLTFGKVIAMKPSFKLWIKLTAFAPLLFLCVFVGFILQDSVVGNVIFLTGLCLLIPLCVTGAVMGILLSMNRLFFGCPFCSSKSPFVGGDKKSLWIECPSCGIISGTYSRFPPLTYRIQKETEQVGAFDAEEGV